jgi:hypothetical protein
MNIRPALLFMLLLLLSVVAGCAAGKKQTGNFWDIEARQHPPRWGTVPKVISGHPRLVFRSDATPGAARTFARVRQLAAEDPVFKKIFAKALAIKEKKRHPLMLTSFYVATGQDSYARAAVAGLLKGQLSKSREPYYSNLWAYALCYDWLFHHPALGQEEKKIIVGKIRARLLTEIAELDTQEQALWHGRNQAANGIMIAALALADLPDFKDILRQATHHYVDSLRALEYSEGWPEGASYWIYNRAGPYSLAADCVISATGQDTISGINIRKVMQRIGYWQIYQYGPDGVFEPYGDSSGSLRLGKTGWWELTADHYARLSGDPGLMAGADYLRNRSPDPYGKRPYYWRIVYTYDPATRPRKDYDPARPELWMRRHLPQAKLFGRKSMGTAFFRGAWGDADECYASFKAGDLLAHHDHYDVGHFSIQCGGLLAPQTGLYGRPVTYFGDHRLGYAVQTVSANSLLILAPGETSAYLRTKKKQGERWGWKALSGGQRVIRPTGFHCVNFQHYFQQLKAGPYLERARITAFESRASEFDYLAADITAAYNSTRFSEPGSRAKVKLVTRQFLYLRREKAFVVYDRIETTGPGRETKFLLHHLSKPRSQSEKVLRGNSSNGILRTFDRQITTTHNRGKLTHRILLPEKSRILKIGGPDYNCYAETDGDQQNGFDGVSPGVGDPLLPRKDAQIGLWRTEVEPRKQTRSVRFLNVLLPRLKTSVAKLPTTAMVPGTKALHALRLDNTICVFSRSGRPLKTITIEPGQFGLTCLVLDALPHGVYRAGENVYRANAEGLLLIPSTPSRSLLLRYIGKGQKATVSDHRHESLPVGF